jgi:hypothetical protein
MRFLRMLTNSLLAGALGAAFLTIIVLQLNPGIPLLSATTWRLFVALALFYGVHLAVVFYLLMVGREFISLEGLSPGWMSVRILAWLTAAISAGASVLMWLNVSGFAAALGESAARRMTAGAAATSATAIVLLGLAAAHYSFGRRGSRVGAALLAIAVFGSLALPVAARGPAVPGPGELPPPRKAPSAVPVSGPRVVMILLDGASLDYILPRTAGRRLPNFARLLATGAAMNLATVRPTGPDPVWAAVATGMYQAKNGVRAPAEYYVRGDPRPFALLPDHCFSHVLVQLGLLRRESNSSASLRARPLWSILAMAGISAGIVRWPLTSPAPPVHGFVLSDRFHQLLGSVLELDTSAAYPEGVLPIARSAFADPGETPDWLPSPVAAADGASSAPERSAGLRDLFYSRAMRNLRGEWPVQLSALRYQGLDTVGHYNLRYTEPRDMGGPSDDERRRRLQVIERYYGFIDGEIGEALAGLLPGDLLLVVSGFGMERPHTLKRVAARVFGDLMSGTHERAPDGFLLAYGSVVEPGRHLRGSIVDVTPTVLYFLGLPVGRDMDGYARPDLFKSTFTTGRPIAFVPTHNR